MTPGTDKKLLAEWFWTDRWAGSDGFLLPMEARGLYREMLTQAWRRGARLPNNHEAIRRATGCTEAEWTRCWPLLEGFWRVDGNNLVNDTQLEIYAEAKDKRDRAQARAQAGAQARHKQVLKQCSPSPSPSPSLSPKQKPPATKPPDPRVKDFLTWFQAEYTKRRHGATYFVRWPKDAPLVKQLLTTYESERLKRHAQILLTTDEAWVDGTDRGIGILSTKINWLEERLATWEATHPRAVQA